MQARDVQVLPVVGPRDDGVRAAAIGAGDGSGPLDGFQQPMADAGRDVPVGQGAVAMTSYQAGPHYVVVMDL